VHLNWLVELSLERSDVGLIFISVIPVADDLQVTQAGIQYYW
jgi:hypothetical protein